MSYKVKKTHSGFPYCKKLPDGHVKCTSLLDFARLKKYKKKPLKGNLERKLGMRYFLYSIRKNIYYILTIHELTDLKKLHEYINAGIIYIDESDISKFFP